MAKKKYDRQADLLAHGIHETNSKFALTGVTKGNTYTAWVEWDGEDTEEIDVLAANEKQAREVVKQALAVDYEPGAKIKGLEQRFGIYF